MKELSEENLSIKDIEEIKRLFKNGDKKNYVPQYDKSIYSVVAVISVILAIIGGVYAMVQPMNLRINTLENTIHEVRRVEIEQATIYNEKHAASQSDRRQLNMQIDGLKGRLRPLEAWHTHWGDTVPSINATQDEKIMQLEEKTKLLQDRAYEIILERLDIKKVIP